jgi:isopentenyldiphosphate isomerase
MHDEQFDVLDCSGKRTGRLISRRAAHTSGAWHGAFHCLVIYRRRDRAYALFQKRDGRKLVAPGKYDVSVGGHYMAGENAELAAPREISEELGLSVSFRSLVPVGRRIFVSCSEPDVIEQEFQDIFLLPLSEQPRGLVLQPEEVEAVAEIEIRQGISLLSGDIESVGAAVIQRDGKSMRGSISAGDFVPCVDRYYLKLLILAHRFLDGDCGNLAI